MLNPLVKVFTCVHTCATWHNVCPGHCFSRSLVCQPPFLPSQRFTLSTSCVSSFDWFLLKSMRRGGGFENVLLVGGCNIHCPGVERGKQVGLWVLVWLVSPLPLPPPHHVWRVTIIMAAVLLARTRVSVAIIYYIDTVAKLLFADSVDQSLLRVAEMFINSQRAVGGKDLRLTMARD